jgi:DNA polymerase I-like protein with 3'-5' exonuclease and polymerase domains
MNWTAPTSFPSLKSAKLIAIDTETRDPKLLTHGPGGARKDGCLVGVSIATDDGFRGYYPIAHPGEGNLNKDAVLRWLKDELSGDQPKVGANLIYDLEWLRASGVRVKGKKIDIQIAEPLIDEGRLSYGLNALSEAYLGEKKEYLDMEKWAEGRKIRAKDLRAHIWEMPAHVVGRYAEADADLALRVYQKQEPLLKQQDLMRVFEVESELIEVLLDMRFKGIPVDIEQAHRVCGELERRQKDSQLFLDRESGGPVDIWSAKSIASACDRLGLSYPRTEKGSPSFKAEWLELQQNDFFENLKKARKFDRLGGVFIKDKIINLASNGRIHPTFKLVKDDNGGTESGRFSSCNPNMQNIPSRNPELTPLIRSIFKPEPRCMWMSADYSAQEPRVTAHYAFLKKYSGSEETRRRYLENPETDYHTMVAEMTGIQRKDAKELNLGLAYGMGVAKMALKLKRSEDETRRLFRQYHAALPFIKLLSDSCSRLAQERGYVKTILGRRRRFNLWGPQRYSEYQKPLPFEEAKKAYGLPLVRQMTHKALNAVVQGSSADMMKLAMLAVHKAGFTPHITIHDELCLSVETVEKAKEVVHIMQNCVDLTIPILAKLKTGPSWGDLKEVKT